MNYHPYSDIWPLMEGADFDKLKADIAANGLRLPVLTYKDKVLDGRNRERACNETGTRVRYEEANAKTDEQALALVVSLNEHRRHLSVAQRAFAGAKLANIINGHNRYQAKTVGGPMGPPTSETVSIKQASKLLGVSRGSIKRARVIIDHGTAADVAEVVAGKVGLQAKATTVRAVRNPRTKRGQQRTPQRTVSAIPVNRPVSGGLAMTREQVDPEFTGTPMEWTDKYGHVQVMTAERYAAMRFGDWASFFRTTARQAQELRDVDLNWLRNPSRHDVAKLTEGLEYWETKIAAARAMLDVAVAAVKQKT